MSLQVEFFSPRSLQLDSFTSAFKNNEIKDNMPARTSPGLTRSLFATTRNRVANDICVPLKILRDTPDWSDVQPEVN